MKLFLVGMPGSGKSTIGKQIADKLKLPFVDLDDIIVDQENQTIPEIFSQKGEDYFRIAERKALKSVNTVYHEFVMATGGGAPCFFDNMAFINDNGQSIFLDVPPKVLADRLLNYGLEERPMFRNIKKQEVVLTLGEQLKTRKHFYDQAKLTVDGNLEADEILQLISSLD